MRIILATGRFREVLTEQQLRRLERTYPLSRWTFTSDIRVEFGALPHSHPVLTLNTRHLNEDDRALATFLHEQLHWAVPPLDTPLLNLLTERYPDLPIGPSDGCQSSYSNYLHIVICTLEQHALTGLIGATRAHAVLQSTDHYRRIYQVTHRDRANLMELIRTHRVLPRPEDIRGQNS
jgi:hypothetical protein